MWRAVLITLLPQRLLSEKNTFNYLFHANVPFLKLLKILEKLHFYGVFRG